MRSSNDTSFKISIFRLQMNWSSVDSTFVSKTRINTNSNVCNSFWNFSASPCLAPPVLQSNVSHMSCCFHYITVSVFNAHKSRQSPSPASWIEFLKCDCWLTCCGCHQIRSAYTVTKECIQFLDSGKTILHFAYSRYCITDNKVQIMGCTMYVKCERLLFMNKLLNPTICATHCAGAVIALSSALIKRSYQQPSDSYVKILECFLDSNFCWAAGAHWRFQHMIMIIFISLWCNKYG